MRNASIDRTIGLPPLFCLFAVFCFGPWGCRKLPAAETDDGRLQRGCDSEDAAACMQLAKRLEGAKRGDGQWGRLLLLYTRGCEYGDRAGCDRLQALHDSRESACNAQKLGECVELGRMYEIGRGVSPDLERAGKLYERACQGGNTAGCNYLAFMYEDGRGRPRDPTQAAKLYRRGCEAKNEASCSNLGLLHRSGRGVPRDLKRALELHEQACKRDVQVGCYSLGVMYSTGFDVPRNEGRAKNIFDTSCKAGHLGSCRELALMIQDDDEAGATKLFLNGCDAGDGDSCSYLSSLYSKNPGLLGPDPREALLRKRACNQGRGRACMIQAQKETLEVETDWEKVIDYWDRSCGNGNVIGCTMLGGYAERGERPFERDLARARAYYELACGWRFPRGCAHLALLYRDGIGVPRNPEKAKALLRLADRAEGGFGCDRDEQGCCIVKLPTASPTAEADTTPQDWIRLPPGRFLMFGKGGGDRFSSIEEPRPVKLSRAFLIQKTEVTQGQFQEVMGYNPSKFTDCGARCPVEYLRWHEAAAYANKLSRREGTKLCYGCYGEPPRVFCKLNSSYDTPHECPGYRLPTEAEWEYAARAGTKGVLYTGDLAELDIYSAPALDLIAWHGGNSVVSSEKAPWCPNSNVLTPRQERCGTQPVGERCPNSWGLQDMLGNVAEWTDDSYGPSFDQDEVTDPYRFPTKNGENVVRGGAWNSEAREVKVISRAETRITQRHYAIGFRLVKTVLAQETEDVLPPSAGEKQGDETR